MTLNDVSNILTFTRDDLDWGMGMFENQILHECDPQGLLVAEEKNTGNKIKNLSNTLVIRILLV